MVLPLLMGASAYLSSQNAKKQQRAYNDIYSQQLGSQNQALGYLAPYNTAGQQGLNVLNGLLTGQQMGPNGTMNTLNPEQRNNLFYQSPDYQFALQQGQKAIDRQAAAGGYTYSGRQLQEATNYTSGLASQNYNNYINSLMGYAGMGQNAAMGQANVMSNYSPILSQLALGGSLPGYDWGKGIDNMLNQLATFAGAGAGAGRMGSAGGMGAAI
ncbi:MAG: DNA injection protein [Phage 33_17]|nr:MAG: DNA injection protein [Phage 33_17]